MNDVPIRPRSDLADRERVLPAELLPYFDDRFVRSCDLYEAYVTRLALEVARRSGLESALLAGGDVPALAERAGFDLARTAAPLAFVVRQLAAGGFVERHGDEFRATAPLPALDAEELAALQREHDPACLPSYALARAAADGYPAFLAGQLEGDAILFGPDRMPLWFDYFSNANPLYAINNTVAALAALRWLDADRPLRVLELGGGLGSAALALIDRFDERGRLGQLASYRFTELAPLFLRRGQRALTARAAGAGWLASGRLDMDQPFGEQGVAPGSVDVVFAVNTLHVARDLRRTLAEVHAALAPGGLLLLGECLRPFAGDSVYVEFVFELLEPFRAPLPDPALRPNGGFLTPEEWQHALRSCGFADVRVYPDVARVRESFPAFVVGALGAFRAR